MPETNFELFFYTSSVMGFGIALGWFLTCLEPGNGWVFALGFVLFLIGYAGALGYSARGKVSGSGER